MNSREQCFAKTFFNGRPFEIPSFFRLSHPEMNRYTPDFYDIERNVYIEVVGSRQAYHQNKEKYEVFQETYPGIAFELRRHTGEAYQPKRYKARKQTVIKTPKPKPIYEPKYKIGADPSLIELINKLGGKQAAADRLEITVRYVNMLLAGKKPSKRLKKLINIYLAS